MYSQRPLKRRNDRSHLLVLLSSFAIVLLLGGVLFYAGWMLGDGKNPKATEEDKTENNVESIPVSDWEPAPVVTPVPEEDTQAQPETEPAEEAEPELEEVTEDDSGETTTSNDTLFTGSTELPEMDTMKEFLPEGGLFVRYWYSKMNDDAFNEVLIGYRLDSGVRLKALGVKDETKGFQQLWDEEVPGSTVTELLSDRVGTDTLIRMDTSVGPDAQINYYRYSDEGPEVIALEGGKFAGTTAELKVIAATNATADDITGVALADDELTLTYGPVLNNQQATETYSYKEGIFTFARAGTVEVTPMEEPLDE